ncbi:hypothetical protein [Sphingopyxis witflariensis]|uniref:Uncharacterized protein n=1 Tax=Sphingopyxis witflariensis TaxID=173675 RepID=A0A246JY74_9SPHN|nr:hypothetical protein [Sphingopyxis witflariensis]OWQ98028.1 hypothetical protein CDQ91_10440 [Sphingopyxis witflariensis]
MIPLWLYGVGGVAIAAVSFGSGYTVRAWKADSDIAKIEQKLEEEAAAQRARADTAAAKYEEARSALDTQSYRTQTTIREVYRNVQVPAECAVLEPAADSLRSSVDAANAVATGKSAPALP